MKTPSRLTLSLALAFLTAALVQPAFASLKGDECLNEYHKYIAPDFYVPGSATLKTVGAIALITALAVLPQKGGNDCAQMTMGVARLALPFVPIAGPIATVGAFLYGSVKTAKLPLEVYRSRVAAHRYGDTFRLMSVLHLLKEEVWKETHPQIAETSTLTVGEPVVDWSEMNAYHALTTDPLFVTLAETHGVKADGYSDFVQKMLTDYEEGSQFCGAREFTPIRFEDLRF